MNTLDQQWEDYKVRAKNTQGLVRHAAVQIALALIQSSRSGTAEEQAVEAMPSVW